jgi:acyl-CoA oxidase
VLEQAYDIVMGHLDRLLDAFDLSQTLIAAPMAQDDYIQAYAGDIPTLAS